RFNRRTKVQRLPIENISQASADQRSGRCGRLGPGVAIRLYDEDGFLNRPEFTEPEVQRTNLASVVLRMASLGLGDAESFPFVDPPEARAIRDGVTLLEELDAIDPRHVGTDRWLTELGSELAAIPIDPKLARMLLEAQDHGCVTEVAIIVAGLSVQDPRIRPTGVGSGAAAERAAQLHARYTDDNSDFLSWLQLWAHIKAERNERSGNGFRKMCRDEYLHFLRIREWEDVHRQLRDIAKDLGLGFNQEPAPPDAIHQALLSGLLAQVGFYDKEAKQYRGTRNARFVVAGGSAITKRTPAWVMAAELVETNQLRARVVAPLNPQWLERSASHLLRWEHSDPWWNEDRGAAMCDERASLYGLPVVPNRQVNLQRIDPPLARELFIRHALVENQWHAQHDFIVHNRSVLADIAAMGDRLRRDIAVDEHTLEQAFDRRVPEHVVSVRHFEKWWKGHRRNNPDALQLSSDELLHGFDIGGLDACPDSWPWGDQHFLIDYTFDPAAPDDGITIEIPLDVLSRVDPTPFIWLVPSLRRELVIELLRTLPKAARRPLVPIPETASEIASNLDPSGPPLLDQLAAAANARGSETTARAFRPSELATHLRPHFRIIDDDDVLAEDDDLGVLKSHFLDEARALLNEGGHALEATGKATWAFGTLPRTVVAEGLGQAVTSYPAVVDEGETVGVRLFATEDEQADEMWLGTRRLLSITRPPLGKVLRPLLSDDVKFAIIRSPYDGPQAWFEDCVTAALDQVIVDAGGPAWNEASFASLADRMRDELPGQIRTIAWTATEVLDASAELSRRLGTIEAEALLPAAIDLEAQRDQLVYDGFIAAVGIDRLADVARYLKAALFRLDRLADTTAKDRDRMRSVHALEAEHAALLEERGLTADLEELAWDLQELRVSLFAQSIGAKRQVSSKRIRSALDDIRRS
ncbi:MAG: ATP-dependent RNA helicase HrpA, partial [Actinomycetota bacterium]